MVKVNQEETTLSGLVIVLRSHSAYALHKYVEQLCIWDTDMYFIRSSYLAGTYISQSLNSLVFTAILSMSVNYTSR